MHLFAPEEGMMGTSGIVGPCILQATGAGYSFSLLKTDQVAVAFFGDGAVNNGAFHEGLNMASIWKLPVLFVCENNQFATEVPFSYAAGNPSVGSRGASYGMPGIDVDGNDVTAIYQAAAQAVARPSRRRAHALGMPHVPHPAARRGDGRLHLPHQGRSRKLEISLPDPPSQECDQERVRHCVTPARCHRIRDRRGRRRRTPVRGNEPLARPCDRDPIRLRGSKVASDCVFVPRTGENRNARNHLHAGDTRRSG